MIWLLRIAELAALQTLHNGRTLAFCVWQKKNSVGNVGVAKCGGKASGAPRCCFVLGQTDYQILELLGHRETGICSQRRNRLLAISNGKDSSRTQICRAVELGLYDGSSNHSWRTGLRDSRNLGSWTYRDAHRDDDPAGQNASGFGVRCCNVARKTSQSCWSRRRVRPRESDQSFCE